VQAVECIAELDCLVSLAITSCYQNSESCRPEFVAPTPECPSFLEIRDATHP
jgi:DNA mismatch repair ATPase MutS